MPYLSRSAFSHTPTYTHTHTHSHTVTHRHTHTKASVKPLTFWVQETNTRINVIPGKQKWVTVSQCHIHLWLAQQVRGHTDEWVSCLISDLWFLNWTVHYSQKLLFAAERQKRLLCVCMCVCVCVCRQMPEYPGPPTEKGWAPEKVQCMFPPQSNIIRINACVFSLSLSLSYTNTGRTFSLSPSPSPL